MKRLLLMVSVILTLSSCSASAHATTVSAQLNIVSTVHKEPTAATHPISLARSSFQMLGAPTSLTLLAKQQQRIQKLQSNYLKIKSVVKKLKKTTGKTWYVFSGATPRGWDCSGLVRWTYEQMGVTLEHSATKQMHSGKVVKQPKVGDIVAFYYGNGRYSFHVGLYIGNGKMIHAYYKGTLTRVDSVSTVAKANWSKVKYIRILDSLPTDQPNT